MLVKFFNGIGRHAGVGEVHHDFVARKFGCHAAADDVEGPDICGSDDAPHVDPRRLLNGVDPDKDFDAGIPV